MNIAIDKNLELEISPRENEEVLSYKDNTIYICGLLFGAYKDGKRYNREDVIGYIGENSEDIEKIIEMIRFSVGGFLLVIKNKEVIYSISSTTCTDYFRTVTDNKIIISDDETYIYQFDKTENLVEDEVIYNIANRLSVSPFNTVFENIKRIVAGTVLIIRPSLNFEQDLYVRKHSNRLEKGKKESDRKKYQQFKDALESTAKIIVENSKSDIYVMVSGIDSVSQLITFSKFVPKERIHAISMYDGCFEEKVNERICKKLGISYIIVPHLHAYDKDITQIRTYFESPFQYLYNNIHIQLAMYYNKNKISNHLVVTGNHTDDVYTVTALNLTETLTSLYPHINTFRRMFTYTKLFYVLLKKGYIAKWRILGKFLKSGKLDPGGYNFHNFLLSISIPDPQRINPLDLTFRFDNPLLDCKEFFKYKEYSSLSPFINSQKTLEDLKHNEIDIAYFNHLVRSLSYINHAPNSFMPRINYDGIGYQLMQPATEGPLSNFFFNYQPNLRDSTFNKRFLYRYFKSEFKESYLSVLRKVKHNNNRPLLINMLCELIPRIVGKVKRYIVIIFPGVKNIYYRIFKPISLKNPHPLSQIDLHYLEYSVLKESYYKYFDKQESLLLPLLKKEINKKYICSLYDELHSEEKPPLFEIRSIDSLINMEMYLKKRLRLSNSYG